MSKTLLTVGELAERLGRRVHQVDYLVKSRGIEPVTRLGNWRVFDESALRTLRREVAAQPK